MRDCTTSEAALSEIQIRDVGAKAMDDQTRLLTELEELHEHLCSQLSEGLATVSAARRLSARLLTMANCQAPSKKLEPAVSTKAHLLTMDQVLEMLGVSRATLARTRSSGKFPQPVRLSQRRIAWKSDEITAWILDNKLQK